MDVAIVYESLFGNTHAVAEAIADGVRAGDPAAHVAVLPVAEAKADEVARAELLIVGGPTHIRGMTSGTSRRKGLESEQQAAEGRGVAFTPEPGAGGPGVRDWFQALPNVGPGQLAAAFDTRVEVKFAGGAAKGIARRLRHHGYEMAGPVAGFIVTGTEGPLRDGEPERARAWGTALIREARQHITA
jgi:flavodoxin